MIALRRKNPQKNDEDDRPSILSFVACRHCGETIPIRNVENLADEFAVLCPRCHRRSFLTRAHVQQNRRA
jgi:hypothetical protein